SRSAIKAAQRQKNLDALLDLAVEYERHCEAQHLAATLTGFLLWLENPHSPELDLQPVVTTGDAVHVLTYHKAKGLEWPIVIAADLHYAWRPRLWDVRVERHGTEFDVQRPLDGRFIRFWPPVFGDHEKDVPVLDALLASDDGIECLERGVRENKRLAYVGLTRARDALVLALPARNAPNDAWIKTIECTDLVPDGDSLALSSGIAIPTRVVEFDEAGEGAPREEFSPRRLPERAPLEARVRETVYPSQMPQASEARIAETIVLDARVPVHGGDMTE